MITTNERQELLLDEYAKRINPAKAREMRQAGLGIIESRCEGAYVWDQSGMRYIDCRDHTSVFNIGRRNPVVADALKKALETYDIGNNLFFSEPRIQLARKLAQVSPGRKLDAVTFGVSGAEVVDFSLKLARSITGRAKVIAAEGGYHGCTGFAVSATCDKTYQDSFRPLVPGFEHVPFGNVKALEHSIDEETACVILEPVQGYSDVRVPPPEYLQAVRRLCDRTGALLIFDEIQTGLGRTGRMFACQHSGVVPDIMTLGKALSGGIFPISAAVYRQEYLRFWEDHPFSHLSTFGGSDLGCVVALATLEYLQNEQIIENAERAARLFAVGFADLKARYKKVVSDVRQSGLLIAVEYVDAETGPQMSRDLTQFGVLASFNPGLPKLMRILPPMTVTEDDVDSVLDAFDRALAGMQWVAPSSKPYVSASAEEGLMSLLANSSPS